MTPAGGSQAHRVRTSLVLGAAGATLIAALLLTRGAPRTVVGTPIAQADDGIALTARFTSTQILASQTEQFVAVSITTPAGAAQTRPPLSVAVVIDRSGSM